MATAGSLVRAIRQTPIIDNHAHPLLFPSALAKHPLLSIVTEASGDALADSTTSLAHLRAVRQLAAVLGCDPTWDAVVAAVDQQRAQSHEAWTRRCLAGIETILVDDGLDAASDVQDFSWHDSFTRSPCKRVVRIEALAASTIHVYAHVSLDPDTVLDDIVAQLEERIDAAIADPTVVSFKSVICYRTGLDIPRVPDVETARKSLAAVLHDAKNGGEPRDEVPRLQHAGLNDYLVHLLAARIRDSPHPKKPIQFHTGLGDNDITLTRSSPAHLQEFIRAYPEVPMVLLHASYPFTREAGYLASVYANVYADIGEVFPFVSQDGQNAVVRQILELCPWSKILWSTDGHWFPETYLLAVVQMREALESVLCDYVRTGQMGSEAAVSLVRDILFHNSNKLYNLGLEFAELETPASTDAQSSRGLFDNLPQASLVRIGWVDYTATPRMRMVPIKKFQSLLASGSADIGITKASLGLLQTDVPIPGLAPSGEYRLHPDLSSLRAGPLDGHVSMQGNFHELDGSVAPLCPRSVLRRVVDSAAQNTLTFRVGFEVEFVLLERIDTQFRPLSGHGHAWSTTRPVADPAIARLLNTMVSRLADAGIDVEQLHAESAPGQFEVVLPHRPPVEAVDALVHARQVLSAAATEAGFRLTLHPKPFAQAGGTASHAHVSVSTEAYESFYAGVLRHLRAVIAFTYASPASYDRRVDGCWAGGTWVAWGTQNREAALRKIDGSHWELKTLDGTANPYLALAAVLAAGTLGFRETKVLVWRDCTADPASLTDGERRELGVVERLPATLEEALGALKLDTQLTEFLGFEPVERYIGVKEAEAAMLGGMEQEERRQWMLERY